MNPETSVGRDAYAYLREPSTPLRLILRALKGMLIGIGAILPGLSGGVLAVVFGLYDPLMRFLGAIRRHFVANVRFFAPVALGGLVGVYLFSVVVAAAFGAYAALFTCLFVGFVVGTLPHLMKRATRTGQRPTDRVGLVVMAVVIFVLMLLGGDAALSVTPTPVVWLIAGAVIGLGVIVPGLSPSNFLLYFGLYDKMANEIKAIHLTAIVPLGVGLVVVVLLLAKVVNRLFDRHESLAYHIIVGSVIGSSLGILPTIVWPAFAPKGLAAMRLSLVPAVALAVLMLGVGFALSYLFSRFESRVTELDAA